MHGTCPIKIQDVEFSDITFDITFGYNIRKTHEIEEKAKYKESLREVQPNYNFLQNSYGCVHPIRILTKFIVFNSYSKWKNKKYSREL